MNNIVAFNNQNIELIRHNGQLYMSGAQIGRVIELSQSDGVAKIYNRHQDEFINDMTTTIRQGRSTVRIFNREGAWLIGMFARTPKAAEFRRWVLKVLGNTVDNVYPCGMDSRVKHGNDNREVKHGNDYDKPVEVVAHTRSLPSGKKEIVLSEKAKAEIGGIVKNCLAAALEAKRPEMSGSSPNMTIEKASPNMTKGIPGSSPGMTKGILGSSPRMTEEISPRMTIEKASPRMTLSPNMTTEIDYNKLSAGVGGWVSMTLMSARYDDLRLEAESLRKRAALCEKQAEEVMKSVKKIESAFGI